MSFRGVAVTTGNSQIAVCHNLCRVLKHGHTANRTFAVCQKKQHTAKVQLTAIILFAVCPPKKHTAKAQHTANMCVCRVLKKDAHGKPLAHGKEPLFAVCLLYCTRQTSGTRQNCAKKIDTTLAIFSSIHIQCIVLLVKICYIFSYFSYI